MKRIPVRNLQNWHPELKDVDPNIFLERKAITTDLSKEADGTIIVVASTPAIDHDMDIVDSEGINTDKYNGSVIWNHNLDDLPVGICTEHSISKDGMIAKIKLSDSYEFAKQIAGLCRENILRAVSIGFIPRKVLKAGTSAFDAYAKTKGYVTDGVKRIIAECELIEISICPVGSNQEALLIAAKSFDEQTKKALKINDEDINKTETEGEQNESTIPTTPETTSESTDPVVSNEPITDNSKTTEEVVIQEETEACKENIEVKPIITTEDNKPVFHWGNLSNEDENKLREQVYGIWQHIGSPGDFEVFWTTGKPSEKKTIKFVDLGMKRNQISNLSEKVYKTLKGLPI